MHIEKVNQIMTVIVYINLHTVLLHSQIRNDRQSIVYIHIHIEIDRSSIK